MAVLFTIWNRSLCAVTGAIAGAFTGSVIALLFAAEAPSPVIGVVALFQMALILAFTAWIVLLFVLAAWFQYDLAAIWLPALVNAVITATLTVLAAYALRAFPYLAPILGAIIGTLVGWLLCRYCAPRSLGIGK